jgi:cytochrome P450
VVRIAPNVVNATDSEAIKAIYGTRETFRKSPFYRQLAVPGEQGLFNTVDVEFHRRHRRLLANPIAESSLWSLVPLIEARLAIALAGISKEMASRGAADVYQWWLRLSTDVISELTFGESFGTLEQDDTDDKHLLQLGEDDDAISLRAAFPTLVRLCSMIPLPIFNRSHDASQRLLQVANQSLERQRHLWATDPAKAQKTLLSPLFKAHQIGTLPFNEIRDEAQNYIAAGSDTVAVTLTFLIWAICRNPNIRSTLVEELQTLPHQFGETHLRSLPYLNQVVNEALRMYPAAPGLLPRLVPQEGFDVKGRWLQAGTEVCAQSFSLHRDPEHFPSPDEFRPSRWANPTAGMKELFIPFSRGARGEMLL